MSSLSGVTKDQGELIVPPPLSWGSCQVGSGQISVRFFATLIKEVFTYLLGPEHRRRGVTPGYAVKLGDAIEADPGGRGADNEHGLRWKYKHFYN